MYIDKVNKDNSVFDKEKRELNNKNIMLLKAKDENEKKNIKDILKERINKLESGIRNRSRKKKEGDIDE